MGKLTIIGNDKPVIGKQEMYSVSSVNDWLNPLQPIKNPLQVQKTHWEVMVQTKTGWRKGGSDKEGQMVPYIFGQKSLFHKGIKIIVRQGEDYGELIVHPQRAKEPKITRVELLDANYKPIPKGKKLSYKDTIIARAYCVEMFEMNIAFTLWEDDAQGEGHNPMVNALNKINPVPVLSRVNEKGMAEAVFRLPFYTMAVLIANARTGSGDKNEGPTHEYYVMADVVSKHIQKASPNVNVINPTYNPEPPRKREVPKKQTPATPKPKTTPAPEKPKPKPDGNSAKFPVTTGGKKSDDPQGKILSAEFVDKAGNRLHSSKVGTTVFMKITAKDMKNKKVKVKIWEEDNIKWTNDKIFEKDYELLYDKNFIWIVLTKKMFIEGNDGGSDSSRQDYFIEVIHNDTSVKSAVMPVSIDATPTEVPSGNSATMVKEPKQGKTSTSCICKEEYKDLIWGEEVSCDFRKKVVQICSELWGESRKMEMANGLMAVMKVETWGSFKAHHREGYTSANDNPKELTISSFHKESTKSSRAVGLIQFTQDALEGMGEFPKSTTTTKGTQTRYDSLNKLKLSYAQMGEIKQLDKVKKYFEPAKDRIKTPEDIYLHVFAPKGVGQKDDFLLYPKGTVEYTNNKSVDKDNNGIQRKEILARFYESKKNGINNKTSKFTCENVVQTPKTGNKISDSGFYIYRDGNIKYIKGTDSIPYYIQVKNGSNEFKKLYTLTKNSYGLIKFPDSGGGFDRYGPVDTGGNSSIENVGKGDHYLLPQTVAALLGIISEINDRNWTIKLGDMSSENGSDPTSSPSKAKAHHAGHGHKGKQSGLNIDFRYFNKDGNSFQGVSSDAVFDDSKNKIFFEIAFKFGFNKNYATGKSYSGVNPKVGGHYDHGHIGALAIEFETVEKIDAKIIQ